MSKRFSIYKKSIKDECVKCSAEDIFNKICIISNNSLEVIQYIINLIIKDIIQGSLNSILKTITNKKSDLFLIEDHVKMQISSSYNQNNYIYENLSSLKLGECESILKQKYNISKKDELIIFKVEYFIDGLYIPIITYEIFNPTTKEKLDLKICENKKINIFIPVSINEENLLFHDKNNDYYNDQCNVYTSEKGTDIILYDRKREFNNKKMSLCEKNCEYKGYNSDTKKVFCQCSIEHKSPLTLSDIINTNKLLNNFIDIKSITNLGVLKCYAVLFSKEGLINNIGSYIILMIELFFIISIYLFYIFDYNYIINIIRDKLVIIKKKEQNINLNNSAKLNNIKEYNQDILKEENLIKIKEQNLTNVSKSYNKDSDIDSKNSLNISYIINKNGKTTKDQYIDSELNSFSYKETLKKDKRNFLQYYLSLLKNKNLIFLFFYKKTDYNSRIIKLCLFLFSFALHYAVNTLFFNDSTMHRIYEDEGVFNFIYLIP